jgi:ketosteroid isomerase-like protein
MSQENVEMLRRGYEAYNRGDAEGTVADFAPTFEYVSTGAIPGMGDVHRGPEGYLGFIRWLWDEFEDARIEVHELIETGNQVLASVTLHGRGRQSGAEVAWDLWQLWWIEDGRAVRGQAFRDKDEALEAAGLTE